MWFGGKVYSRKGIGKCWAPSSIVEGRLILRSVLIDGEDANSQTEEAGRRRKVPLTDLYRIYRYCIYKYDTLSYQHRFEIFLTSVSYKQLVKPPMTYVLYINSLNYCKLLMSHIGIIASRYFTFTFSYHSVYKCYCTFFHDRKENFPRVWQIKCYQELTLLEPIWSKSEQQFGVTLWFA